MSPDELLAEARRAQSAFRMAEVGSPEEWGSAVGLSNAFAKLDEHLTAGGKRPADWTPPDRWDVVLPCDSQETAERIWLTIEADEGFPGYVQRREDRWDVVIPFKRPVEAEHVLAKFKSVHGWPGSIKPRRSTTTNTEETPKS